MTIARTSMRFHPKGLPLPNPNGIQVGYVHHQGPSHPKVRVKSSGRGEDVSGVTSAISRTTALLGSQDKLPQQDQIQVGRKGVRRHQGVPAGSRPEALANRKAPEIPD